MESVEVRSLVKRGSDDVDFNSIRIEHARPEHGEIVVVNWCLGNICNYSCSYCPESLHNGSIPWMDTNVVTGFSDRLIRHYQEKLKRKIYVEFTGGEPSLHKGFIPVLRHLKESGVFCGVISNGSLPVSFWKRTTEFLDHICLSFHPESASPKAFLEVVEFMHAKVSTHLNIMMNPEHFDICMDVAKSAAKMVANTSISLQPVFEKLMPSSPLKAYTPEQQRQLAETEFSIPWNKAPFTYRGSMRVIDARGESKVMEAPQFIARGTNQWKGWKCWAGVDEIVIYSDGTIYRGWCKQDRIGNVADEGIDFPAEPTTCAREACHCNLDIMNKREAPIAKGAAT